MPIIDISPSDGLFNKNKSIVFAINSEGFPPGYDNRGFMGTVFHYWPELANIGEKQLGEIISYESRGKIFHALVCHSFIAGDYYRAPRLITQCLDQLIIPDIEPIAFALIKKDGVDMTTILGGIARSKKSVTVYHVS